MSSSQYRAVARNALKGNWGMSVLVTFIAGLLGATVSIGHNLYTSSITGAGSTGGQNAQAIQTAKNPPSWFMVGLLALLSIIAMIAIIYSLVVLVIGGAIKLGLCNYNINLVNRAPQNGLSTLFGRLNTFGKAFLLQLITGVLVFLWSLLLIIPGIIAMYRYAMAPFIMAQNPGVGIIEAIQQSKQMMKGHKWQLFVLQLSFIGWAILCVFTMGIGLLWLAPYIGASNAAFYLHVSGQQPVEQPQPIAQPTE